jgi:hypothetical protein
MRRFQARRSSGRFTRNTTENTFGFSCDVCESCRRITTWTVGEPRPNACTHCGGILESRRRLRGVRVGRKDGVERVVCWNDEPDETEPRRCQTCGGSGYENRMAEPARVCTRCHKTGIEPESRGSR